MLKKLVWRTTIIFSVVVVCTACKNLFIGFTDYNTDEAKYSQAITYLNALEYDKAIAEIQKTSATFQARRQTRYIMASAYAGKCGLNTVGMIESFDNIGSMRLFPFLVGQFIAKGVDHQTACQQAEMQLRLVSEDPDVRTPSENLMMVLIAFAKTGVILNKSVDTNDDGAMDGGYLPGDHCVDPTMVSNSDVNQLITAITQIIHSLPKVGTSFGSAELGTLTSACDAMEAVNPIYNFCNVLTASDATDEHRQAFRAVLGSNTGVGLGNCNGGLDVCECFPP